MIMVDYSILGHENVLKIEIALKQFEQKQEGMGRKNNEEDR